ncbi:MAG: hypothetical protein COT85_03000 [Chlamydiae bacterium CG10_big_fil_rev_8_21_14_0_10_42_34]|nr:MAG: hypothetical protein COT85_03000 [Chlamydiae bacterium CG10_big_fil_rev_8_21_14_0_10_42_34]
MCPLKDAARDAPNHLAILSKDFCLTFSELDSYVDQITDNSLIAKEANSLNLIAKFFSSWRKGASIFPINPRNPSTPLIKDPPSSSVLLYTSGSTSAPKIAILPFQALLASAESAIKAVDLRPNDQWKLSLPLYHVGGIGIVLRCIAARATIVLDDSPHITHLSCVPTQLYRATPIYKNLRCLLVGGAPIPNYPYTISTTYGLTEMGSMVTLNGKVMNHAEVQIDANKEIFVRGKSLFQGYLGQKSQNGWFATGDLGRFEQKNLIITGRKDWMFISGGENIQPEEIEKEMQALPFCIEAVVVGKNDPEFGKRPVAFVRAHQKFDLLTLQTILSNTLPKYKIPIALYFVDELPRKNNFKVDRFILSQLINNQLDQNMSGQKKASYL